MSPPNGRRRPVQAAPPKNPTADHDTTLVTFEWRRCSQHPWLGVSVLRVGGYARCILEDGSEHPVELERAA